MDDEGHKIVIESLQVFYDAERQRDEAVFADLFDRNMARRDQERGQAHAMDARACRARAVPEGRAAW